MRRNWKESLICAALVACMISLSGCKTTERHVEETAPEDTHPEQIQQEVEKPADSVTTGQNPEESDPPEEKALVDLGKNIAITEVKSFAGMYFEDGSDEIVSNVMMLMVENRGTENVQLADITAKDEAGNEYAFRITTLLPGSKVTVLEANRAEYSKDTKIVSAELINLALFAEVPQMYEDVLEFTCADHMVQVKNISGDKFAGGRVCYKNASGDIYIGGITYSLTIPALEPGEETTLYATHFTEGASKLAFVNYAK